MSADHLVAFVCCDLGAIVRGRSVLARELEEHLQTGVGWVPANHSLTPLGPLAQSSPFGSTGDLRLLPDLATRVTVPAAGDEGPLDFVLCDIVETDGQPWVCCPRRFLREALAELERELGAQLEASFEHEFQLLGESAPALPFSLEAQRRAEPFAGQVMAALSQAGVEPERFVPEFAARQFVPPAAVVNNPNPKLLMDPTLIGPPDVQLPNNNMNVWGDPLAKIGPPSNGPGSGGGIGSGSGGGVGSGKGAGFGPGEGGGTGGGTMLDGPASAFTSVSEGFSFFNMSGADGGGSAAALPGSPPRV